MKKHYTLMLALGIILSINFACSPGQTRESKKGLLGMIDQIFADAAEQYKFMMTQLEPDRFPRSYNPHMDRFISSGSGWWCSGFYPGVLLYLYEQTKDQALVDETVRILKVLEKEQFNTSTHDLGFMMYCSFGLANQIKPEPEYKDILINSAKSLSTRFNPNVGCIKSWNSRNENDFLVIIDNMMNLELLFWAARETGDSAFYQIAVSHADTTIKNHFREDNSSYHVLNYHPETGEVQQKRTAQGFSDESAWARGQAWGVYGFTVMYRETKDQKYLDMANKIARYILDHPNLPEDKIPYWDFNAPNIPYALRDASAGAIAASALLELQGYVEGEAREKYLDAAETMLLTLSSNEYRAEIGENGGFILKHGVGHIPENSEVDVPLTYADFYYIEALKRYKELKR